MFVVNVDCFNFGILITILQKKRERNQLRPLSFRWYWEDSFLKQSNENKEKIENFETIANASQRDFSDDEKFIINLQNFKYEIKRNLSLEALGEFLVNSDFIEGLLKEHVNQHRGGVQSITTEIPRYCKRDPTDLLKFNENRRENDISRQSYGNALLEKIEKKEHLKNLIKAKNIYLNNLFKVNKYFYFIIL